MLQTPNVALLSTRRISVENHVLVYVTSRHEFMQLDRNKIRIKRLLVKQINKKKNLNKKNKLMLFNFK